jgi:hypothetical protein
MVAYAYAAMYPEEVEKSRSWMRFCPASAVGGRLQ